MDKISSSLDSYFSPEVSDLLIAAYTEPHRQYHTMMHIWHMLDVISEMVDFFELSETDKMILHRMAWWHDAVYEPGSPTSESASAVIYSLSGDEQYQVVHNAILDTKLHKNPSSFLSACLIDADLLGLGANPHIYEINRRNVRAEFAQFSDEEWIAGRTKFIESMSGPIFLTSFGAKYEDQAHRNLENELAQLRSGT